MFYSNSCALSMQQRLVMVNGKCLYFTGSLHSNPSFLPSGSSHSVVGSICSNSTVVVHASGNLHVAIHTPFFTMTKRNRVNHLVERTQESWFITITPRVNTDTEAYLAQWPENAKHQTLRTKSYVIWLWKSQQ